MKHPCDDGNVFYLTVSMSISYFWYCSIVLQVITIEVTG